MKHRLFLVALFSLFALLVSPQLVANPEAEQKSPKIQVKSSALTYLKNMKQAYKQLNYELLYLNTAQNQIEPKQLIHGVFDGKRITYFCFLNGSMRESLQFDGKISYYQQGNPAYSLVTKRDQSVFANIASFDFDAGMKSYEYLILGKNRIAGKKAIAIRMTSKDVYRYSYIIWLDLNSYLPLRLETINKSNQILEQTMVVSLNVSESINPWIKQMSVLKTPDVLHFPKTTITEIVPWEVSWLPPGFKIVRDDQHKLMVHDTDPISYIMLNDGLVSVSIYISTKKTTSTKPRNVIQRGATLLYTEQKENIEVDIIGEIPLLTADKIAASIRANK